MKTLFSVLAAGFRAELLHILRMPLFVALTIIQAVTFLFLVSLFGLTGSRAPTALVSEDQGPYAREFIAQLASTYNSFDLRPMDKQAALAALHRGSLVAIITIPANFSSALIHGQTIKLHVDVDNVNTDMTDDIQRALPSAIVAFGREHHFPGIRVQGTEVDLIDHDTGFIPYLVVSALALDVFIIASLLSALAVTREFEGKTIKQLAVAPVHPLFSLLGRLLATDTVAIVAMIFPLALTVFGYRIIPLHPLEVVGVMLLCVTIFGCIGVALGALLRRTLPVVSLIFGLGFPFYLGSGSLEPQRFDGELIWIIAHISPVYYAVGILEQAFHGLQVTPEAIWLNFLILPGWAALALLLASLLLRTSLIERIVSQPAPWRQRVSTERQRRRIPRPRFALSSVPWLLAGLIVLAIGGEIWYNAQQHQTGVQQIPNQQQTAQASVEKQRETQLVNDYTRRVSALIAQDSHLYTKAPDPNRTTVSTLTRQLLPQLDCEHKVTLLRYLYQKKFIDDDFQVVSLQGMTFHACNLANLDLSDTDLSGVDFSNANMHHIQLTSTTLISVNFHNANLTAADLKGTDMHKADIRNADLSNADLAGAIGQSNEQLLQARLLAGTRLPDGTVQPGEVQDTD